MTISCLLEFTKKVSRAYSARSQPVAQQFGITNTAFDILMFLANNPEYYTARDISTYRNMKPNVVSIHVDRLVKEGYLRRESIPEDRRKIRLICTSKAQPVIAQGQTMQRAFFQHLTAGLSTWDLETFNHCFRVMGANADTPEEKI